MFANPWTEKYRPNILDNFIQNDELLAQFKSLVESKTVLNLILAGPPGTGKTTVAHCIANAVFGRHKKHLMLELNASEERGIDVVRTTIKNFSKKDISFLKDIPEKVPLVKLILLDEADSLTPTAQQALRRTMETNSGSTRFIFTCNLSNKLIEPIQSRCSIMRFKALSHSVIKSKMLEIANKESLKVSESLLEKITLNSEGDLRKAVGVLQAISLSSDADTSLEEGLLEHLIELPPRELVEEVMENAVRGDVDLAFAKLRVLYEDKCYSAEELVNRIWKVLEEFEGISPSLKTKMLMKVGECLVDVREHGDKSFTRVAGVVAEIVLLSGNYKEE